MSSPPTIEGVSDLQEIGRGGFGVVYRGTETEFGRNVAVKVLPPSLDEQARRRFARERRAMGSLSDHPNIVTVYRGGVTADERPYLVMELLRGGTLHERVERTGPLPWRDAALLGAKLADALSVAHRSGILHRDIKPANVFQTESGEPKLGDFGIARLDDGNDSRTGSITASIAHAPPEILDGQRGDERSDVYSLASTLYAAVTGSAPFSRNADLGVAALVSRISTEEAAPLGLGGSAAEFEATILRALAKSPAQRPSTAAEFGAQLRRAASNPDPAGTDSPLLGPAPSRLGADATTTTATTGGGRLSSLSGRNRTLALAAVALVVAGLGGWLAARAALGSQEGDSVAATVPTSAVTTPDASEPPVGPEPSAAPSPAATPPEPSPEPSAAPSPEPSPQATVAPRPTRPPTPVAGSSGGVRGTDLGDASRFVSISDDSGAITVRVPPQWAETVSDGSDLPLEAEGLTGVRLLAAGAGFPELSGDQEDRDLTVSGIYVFAARIGSELNPELLLTQTQAPWSDCDLEETSDFTLLGGPARYQLRACPGSTAGVVVMAHVPDADPTVGVSIYLQFAQVQDLDALPTILATLRVDPALVPALDLDLDG